VDASGEFSDARNSNLHDVQTRPHERSESANEAENETAEYSVRPSLFSDFCFHSAYSFVNSLAHFRV